MPDLPPYRVLFVCWGNICRSPTAEALLRREVRAAELSDLVEVDSAGVSAEHSGNPPDRRSQAEARSRGLDMSDLRARRVSPDDWDRFDLLLVTDDAVERSLRRQAPRRADLSKVARITDFLPTDDLTEVPDPYYGGADGFRHVFDLLEEASTAILTHAVAVRS
ncbi:MAG TPA: low molecular weight protein-tyrosine-phosphatase [Acidimicrobiales bacterium]|nr:low molecular weight protein-tyrosine-phosphatase [Acidimicrobiales bacterium]